MNIKSKITAIIVDDEIDAIKNLESILIADCPDVSVIKTCSTIKDAYKSIKELNPQLVFLDIDLGNKKTSFDLLKLFDVITFKIVFVTAFNEFALQAIKYAALDYVLKPIDDTELIQAVEKVKKSLMNSQGLKLLQEQVQEQRLSERIALNLGTSVEIVAINDIIYIDAAKVYTYVYLNNGSKYLVSKSISDFEELLFPKGFYRIHKSHIINVSKIKNYSTRDGGSVTMINNQTLSISERKRQAFFEELNTLFRKK